MSEDDCRRGRRGKAKGKARRVGRGKRAGLELVGVTNTIGGEAKKRALQTPPQPLQPQRLRQRRLPQLQQETQREQKQKTTDAFRVRLRSGEHVPDAAPRIVSSSSKRFSAVFRAKHKMLKGSTCTSVPEPTKTAEAIRSNQHINMTTAKSPPPQQTSEAASQDESQDREGAASASEDLGSRPVCAICDAVLANALDLSVHVRLHQDLGVGRSTPALADVDGYVCRVCRKVFASDAVLDRHVLSHPGEQLLKCPLCDHLLTTNGGIHRHMRSHASQFEVDHNDHEFPRGAKRRHQDSHHDGDEVDAKRRSPGCPEDEEIHASSRTGSPIPGQRFTCPVCPTSQTFQAPYLHELEAHLEQAHRDYCVFCDLCGESFKSVRVLNLHRYSAHRGKTRTRDVVGFKDLTFVDFTSEKFPHIARAECEKSWHRASTRQYPFLCECGRAFPCGSALAIHRKECPHTVYGDTPADLSAQARRPELEAQQDHTRDDFFAKLDLLNKSTPTSPALSASPGHARQPHSAPERDLADIQSMMSVTSGLIHDQAEEDQQDAFEVEVLRMKQRGEFPCRLCTKVYPNLRALKGHNREHMSAPGAGADGYRCNICPRSAVDKLALQRHMRTHNGARPYECALCKFAFTTKANCERHLRNRHAKCSREDVKSSIIYHPSEDPGNDSLDVKRTLFPEPSDLREDDRPLSPIPLSAPAPAPVALQAAFPIDADLHRRPSLDVATMTSEDEADRQSPLDLSMVLDLSKKRPPSPPVIETPIEDEEDDLDDDQPQDLSRKSFSESTPAVTVTPHSPLPPQPEAGFLPLGSLYPYRTGLPFSPYYPGFIRDLQRGLLIPGSNWVLDPLIQRQAFLPGADASIPPPVPPPATIPLIPEHKDEPSTQRASTSPKSERSSASDSQAHSKMVMKNGMLIPKQKQRRYRTERPHVCEHCSARFTLSSNRERHVKQQHPQFWSQRHRGPLVVRDTGAPASSSPADPPATHFPAKSPSRQDNKPHNDVEDEDEELVIDEGTPQHSDHVDEGAEGDAEDEGQPTTTPGEDLASVSRLLDNASTQTFRQFFRDGEENAPAPHEENSEEDEEGLVAGSPSEENNSGSEEKSESESTVQPKKKSAYSLAPNRVSCPYCSRKFPWSSSLRRHVLTHTGQKPYKCLHCPLLFTTKSNCDRHLARKHSNKDAKDINTSSSGVSSGNITSTPNTSTTTVSPGSSASSASPPDVTAQLSPQGFQVRNVPDRPFKCRHCPSSTFATHSNLRKHVATKHIGLSVESCTAVYEDHSRPTSLSGYESHSSVSDDPEHPSDMDTKKNLESESELARPLSLCKSEREPEIKSEPLSLCKSSPEQELIRSDSPAHLPRSPLAPVIAPVACVPEISTQKGADPTMALSSSELPFKCHLCDSSFTERQECLDHIRLGHSSEYEILLSKGALELSVAPEDGNNGTDEGHNADGENIEHLRGKFPDYANRKVMCAFCMRRFWSAEDLRRHMRTHTGERPFSCDVCRRRFTLKHSMLRHRKKHNELTNNNSINVPLVNTPGAEDLSPSAVSGDEDGYGSAIGHPTSPAELLMHRGKRTNHNNNNINMTTVSKMLMAWSGNPVNLRRAFRRREDEDSGLIGNLLGIGDPSIIDKVLLSKSADDAEKLLGVFKNNGRS